MIVLEGGKYTLIIDHGRTVYKCLRYNDEWRDVTGDKLILALYDKVEELQAENKRAFEQLGDQCTFNTKLLKKIKELEAVQPTPVAYFDNSGKLQGRINDEKLLALCSRAVIDIKMRNDWSETEFFCTQYLSLAGGRPTLTQLPYRDWPDWANSINPALIWGYDNDN